MTKARFVPVLVVAFLLAAAACGPRKADGAAAKAPSPKFSGMAYQNDGKQMTVIASMRAATITGPQEFLAVHMAILNKNIPGRLSFSRESFTLEYRNAEGKKVLLPIVDDREFEDEYRRFRVDLRIGTDFLETLNGRYPSPPFTKLPLEFYSMKGSGLVPRRDFSVRKAEIAIGYIYFRLPTADALPEDGKCQLLFKPAGFDDPLVVDIWAYKEPK
jgi:hypothetical protein